MIRNKILKTPNLIDPSDNQKIDKVLRLLIDQELLNHEEIIEHLKSEENFEELVQEALQTDEQEA